MNVYRIEALYDSRWLPLGTPYLARVGYPTRAEAEATVARLLSLADVLGTGEYRVVEGPAVATVVDPVAEARARGVAEERARWTKAVADERDRWRGTDMTIGENVRQALLHLLISLGLAK